MKWFQVSERGTVRALTPGKWIVGPDGVQHDYVAVTERWSSAKQAHLSVYAGVPATVPPGQQVRARHWAWTGSVVEERLTTEPLPPKPTKRDYYDATSAAPDALMEAIIAGLAELKGLPVPATKAWLKGML